MELKEYLFLNSLHSIKLFRSKLVKSEVIINDLNDPAYNLGKTLYDLKQNGKMKDSYPMTLFSSETIENAIKNYQWDFVFYVTPFNFIVNAIRNPFISIQFRQELLESEFYFLFCFLNEFQSDDLIHSWIWIVRMLKTFFYIFIIFLDRPFHWIKSEHTCYLFITYFFFVRIIFIDMLHHIYIHPQILWKFFFWARIQDATKQ